MPQPNLRAVIIAFALQAMTVACSRGVLHTGAAGTTVAPSLPVPAHGNAVEGCDAGLDACSAPGTDPGGSCDPGRVTCPGPGAGYCFDLQASPEHCGTCDHACAPGSPCEQGQCRAVTCTSPMSVRTLRPEDQGGPSTHWPALMDCNRDGALDMMAFSPIGLSPNGSTYEPGKESVSVYQGNGDGTFAVGDAYPLLQSPPGASLIQLLAADLDRDQIPDLIIVTDPGPTSDDANITIFVRLGRGDCTFGPEIGLAAGARPNNAAIADFDGDGVLDLVVASAKDLRTFRGKGNGSFSPGQVLEVGGYPPSVVVTDWNSDGIPDLVTAEEYLHVFLGIGQGQFAPAMDCAVRFGDLYSNRHKAPPVIADFDQDGAVDLATNNTVLFGMRECNYTRLVTFPALENSALPLLAQDFNGDGALDIAFNTWQGMGFLPGDGHGGFGTIVMFGEFQGTYLGSPFDSLGFAGDLNGDGRLDMMVTSDVGVRILINTCQ